MPAKEWGRRGLRGGGLLLLLLSLLGCSRCITADEALTEDLFSYPVLWDEEAIVRKHITYTDGRANMTGYLSLYNNTMDKKPVVLVVPDADGIGAYERWRADLFASLGYVGVVVDIYGSKIKQGPQMPLERRNELAAIYAGNGDMFKGRIMAAIHALPKVKNADLSKLVIVGYSFGGAGAIHMMRAWPDTDGILGVASFHGAPLWMKNFTPIANGCPIRAAIFGCGLDLTNSQNSILEFRAELDAANVTWQWMDFGGAVSGFTQPDRPFLQSSEQLVAYNPTADVMSWFALRGWLLDVFGYINPQNLYVSGNLLADYQTGFTSSYASPAQDTGGAVVAGVAEQSAAMVTGAGR